MNSETQSYKSRIEEITNWFDDNPSTSNMP
jgi:hypothetical protein